MLGSYLDTWVSDDAYESVSEEVTGGNPANRTSRLEHRLTIAIPSGTSVGDEFAFDYSIHGGASWIPIALGSLPTSDLDAALAAPLPGALAGTTILLRVVDTDRSPSQTAIDTVWIDRIHVRVLVEGAGRSTR